MFGDVSNLSLSSSPVRKIFRAEQTLLSETIVETIVWKWVYIADGENTTNSGSSLIFLQPRVPINKQLGDDETSCVIRIPLPNSWTLVESVDFASPAFSSV